VEVAKWIAAKKAARLAMVVLRILAVLISSSFQEMCEWFVNHSLVIKVC